MDTCHGRITKKVHTSTRLSASAPSQENVARVGHSTHRSQDEWECTNDGEEQPNLEACEVQRPDVRTRPRSQLVASSCHHRVGR